MLPVGKSLDLFWGLFFSAPPSVVGLGFIFPWPSFDFPWEIFLAFFSPPVPVRSSSPLHVSTHDSGFAFLALHPHVVNLILITAASPASSFGLRLPFQAAEVTQTQRILFWKLFQYFPINSLVTFFFGVPQSTHSSAPFPFAKMPMNQRESYVFFPSKLPSAAVFIWRTVNERNEFPDQPFNPWTTSVAHMWPTVFFSCPGFFKLSHL